ncbi:hypothetical protein [Bacillus coahuilensis]|uniref:hypothetical protein n=1 Tax=Bacillus coahuilensis TaxID=408580 RepID=UPI00018508D7|nr:hypothetical protein [Bacillus coahuilensis]
MKEHAASSYENEENLKDEISRIAPSLARLAIQLGISKLALNDKISKVLLNYLDEGFDKVTTQKRFIQSVTENESHIESEDLLYFEEDQSLHNTIIQLPLMERKVVVLSEFESLTNQEIEEWLSITSDEIVSLQQHAFEKIQSSSKVELNYNQWKDRFSLLQDAYKKLDLPYDVDSIVNRIVTTQSTSEVMNSMEKEKYSTSSQKVPIKKGVLISVFSLGILLGGLTGAVLLPNSVSTAFSADLTKEEKKALNSLLSFYEERKEEVRSSLGVSSRSLDQSTSKAELDFELFQAVKLAEEDPNNNENLFNDMEAKITEGLATPQMVLEDLKESDTEIDADAFVIKLRKSFKRY